MPADSLNHLDPALRILHLEDNFQDAELVKHALSSNSVTCELNHVSTRSEFVAALDQHRFDLIISDYTLPSFDGLAALEAARSRCPQTPFIFVSGTLGEDKAVEALRGGAVDYVLKDHLARLAPAVRRAVAEAAVRSKGANAEEALRQAELRYRTLFEQSPYAVVVIDPDTTLPIEFNDGACRQLGYSREEFSRLRMPDYDADRDETQIRAAIAEILRLEKVEYEVRHRSNTGQIRNIWAIIRAIKIAERVFFYSIWNDITERKQMEQQLRRTQRLESIGTLAAGIAHDLNNSLAPILMGTALLRDHVPQSAIRLLETMVMSAQRGAAMVRQLLTFAKGIEGQRVPIQPRQLLNEMGKIIRSTFPKTIQPRISAPADLSAVLGDATQLHQVLLNLCVNARDAMPDGGTLGLDAAMREVDAALAASIEGAQPGNYVVIKVSDSGVGIPPEILDRIFEPFFTTKGPEQGTGLGLSTVLGIVRSHHGFVRVETKRARGTTFSVYLPALAVEADTEIIARTSEFQGKGELVLIVDDEPTVRSSLQMLLEQLNFAPVTASGAPEALVIFAHRRTEIGIVICDLQMPQMDGVAVVRAIKSMSPHVGIIVISGNATDRQIMELKQLRVGPVLTKPFSLADLKQALKRIATTSVPIPSSTDPKPQS